MLIQSLVSLVDNFMAASLGDAKLPLVISVSATLINTFLDGVSLSGAFDPGIMIWDEFAEAVDSLYDVDRLWNKGGDWKIEYKYRRGGKMLCTFCAKKNVADLLITYGKAVREKFEEIEESVSKQLQDIYEKTETLHDGKWL